MHRVVIQRRLGYDQDGDLDLLVGGRCSWEKEDGLFKLNFRKFKKPDDEKSDKSKST